MATLEQLLSVYGGPQVNHMKKNTTKTKNKNKSNVQKVRKKYIGYALLNRTDQTMLTPHYEKTKQNIFSLATISMNRAELFILMVRATFTWGYCMLHFASKKHRPPPSSCVVQHKKKTDEIS